MRAKCLFDPLGGGKVAATLMQKICCPLQNLPDANTTALPGAVVAGTIPSTRMKKVNLQDVPEVERRSPHGKFHSFRRNISEALGREPDSADLLKRHPFDLALIRIPPGASLCPYHSHSAEWEMYVVVAGVGDARDESGIHQVIAGDAFLYAPGEAHQLSNTGVEDFVYYVLADNPVGGSCHYPDSQKWSVYGPSGERFFVRGEAVDYFDGEE
jgi:uncharacterized cupin superfamily protein